MNGSIPRGSPVRWLVPAAFAIAACASEPVDVDPSAAPPPAAAEVFDVTPPPLDPAMQLRAGVGVGPLRFGMQDAEIIDAVGLPARRIEHAFDFGDRGLTLLVDVNHGLNAVFIGGWLEPDAPYLQRFGGRTPSGVGMLSTAGDLRRAWGDPWLTRHIERQGLVFDILWFDALSGWAALRGGRVVYLSMFDPVLYETLKENPSAGMP